MKTAVYPLIPLRDIVVFPHMAVTLFVGRHKSIAAIQEAVKEEGLVILAAQKTAEVEDPLPGDLYTTGVIAHITQMIVLPDGTIKLLVEGMRRAQVQKITSFAGMLQAEGQGIVSTRVDAVTPTALQMMLSHFQELAEVGKKIPADLISTLVHTTSPEKFIDLVAAHIGARLEEKQQILEEKDLTKRFEKTLELILLELDTLRVEDTIKHRVKQQMEKNHRDYYLNEQIKVIQNELQKDGDGNDDLSLLRKRIETTPLSDEARKKAEGELKKLRQMSTMSSEASVVRNYLEWLLDLPWGKAARLKKDLAVAEKVLNRDHFGLEKVKERILEHLAVQQRVGKACGTILCLVGPPGVGKTSLGRSIAEATGRQFVRMSLGGMRDEAEIRGHRRTYVGAMPGRIIQGMKKVHAINPVFLLDEIDKLGTDWRGDPSSALLEVLDPEQNNTFSDHYLEVAYDLSNVMFIATANSLNIPRPLMDRMEIIRIPGYTEDEKVEIAKNYLIPKQIKANGLKKTELQISDDVLRQLIRYYTSEAGVRGLEREVGSLARKVLKGVLTPSQKRVPLTSETLSSYLGVKKYRYGLAEIEPKVGVATGLAWTEVGGDILHIEVVTSEGKGNILLTGTLGDVMKESIQTALSYIRSVAGQYGIDPKIFMERDIHVHVPEGATPKDGPSAGIGMCVALISALTGIPVLSDVAMTGEFTLRGKVLPIGGLKEKLLAAMRGGLRKVLIPEDNIKDLEEVPQNVKEALKIVPVSRIDLVLTHALQKMPEPAKQEKFKETTPFMMPVSSPHTDQPVV